MPGQSSSPAWMTSKNKRLDALEPKVPISAPKTLCIMCPIFQGHNVPCSKFNIIQDHPSCCP